MNKKTDYLINSTKLTVADDSITLKNGQSWKNQNCPVT